MAASCCGRDVPGRHRVILVCRIGISDLDVRISGFRKTKAGGWLAGPAPGAKNRRQGAGLHVGVAGAKHCGEPRRLFLAPAFFTRLFKVPVIAHHTQGSFAVNLLLHVPQGPFDRFAFLQFNFGQYVSLPSRVGRPPGPLGPISSRKSGPKDRFAVPFVSTGKTPANPRHYFFAGCSYGVNGRGGDFGIIFGGASTGAGAALVSGGRGREIGTSIGGGCRQ